MLTVLGKPAHPAGAVDLLLECHDRIRSFLALARRIPGAVEEDPTLVAEAAERVRRYFVEALPLHAQDEEGSILPRLQGRDAAVDAALATMVREHREHERPLGALVAECELLSRDPGRLRERAVALAAPARALDAHFDVHLRAEETVIFPAVRRILDPAADLAVVHEIRRRRGVVEGAPAGAPAAR
jgi:hemerythrin-like domain-containing protein